VTTSFADRAGSSSGLDPHELERLRRRTVRTLVAGVALGSTGHIAAITVAVIVAEELAGTSALSGAPSATVVLGAAIGASLLSAVMVRRGRRQGLAAGYAIGVVGAFLAVAAILAASLPLLLAGTLLIGFGNSSNLLSRYAAADLFPPTRRASAIGTVVWGSTIGAVVGPNLVGIGASVATALGLPELAGPYLVPIVFVGLASGLSWWLLRPDPYELADVSAHAGDDGRTTSARLVDLLSRPAVRVAIAALLVGQVVMVLIMTMTPLHMKTHGHDLTAVGIVISGHTFGMYALSPISGRLTDRFGNVSTILAGTGVLAFSAILSAVAPPDGGVVLFVALFLLGWGWNLGFVAGSELLTSGLRLAERTRVQGLVDTLIWSSAAAASLGSGVVVAAAGYATLGLLGAALVVVPAWFVIARRASVRAAHSGGTAGS
jgi:MFS family permease